MIDLRRCLARGRVPVAVLLALSILVVLGTASWGEARMAQQTTLGDLVVSAGRIVRARCVAADPGTAEVAGAHLRVTTYTFEVGDPLKGAATGPLVFRQVGTPAGGPSDLGARVGLPVYEPGVEYVLFLLPESVAGLTSPAGAGDGAFLVRDEQVVPLSGAVRFEGPPAAGARGAAAAVGHAESLPYETFRQVVRDLVTP